MSTGHTRVFVDVQQMPGKKDDPIYIVTTESSLASILEAFLEARTGRRCPYLQGSFMLHGAEAQRLLR